MAAPRRKQNLPPEQDAKPCLMVAAAQLRTELDERIALGEKLLEPPVGDQASLEARRGAYYSWHEYNLTLLEQSFDSAKISIEHRHVGIGWPTDRPVPQMWEWLQSDISGDVRRLTSLRDQLGLYKLHPDAEAQGAQMSSSTAVGTEVFIVHGHDDGMKETVARFLAKLVGRQPVILHEQPDRGRTIIEKFEDHAVEAACAVILLTADDTGGPAGGEQQPRARQNVVLELGYFIGKLGRDRVIILNAPGIELPSDIQGILYTGIDKNEAWRMAVARELRAIGIEIDPNAVF